MKTNKKLNLRNEYENYKGSDLHKICNNNPLPIKYTINELDCYFYNADLFGLFELKILKNGLTVNDFIEDYRNGFESGLLHLQKVEKIKLKHLKNINLREHTLNQLKHILHEREFKENNNVKGLLNVVFRGLPLVFTKDSISDFAYKNGIIYSIDTLCDKAGLKDVDLKNIKPLKDEDKITLDDIKEKRNNLIADLPIIKIYEFFKTLVTTSNKKGQFYLTEKKLLLFIKSTFIDLEPKKIDFDVAFSKDKQSVRSVFKRFEIECVKFEKNKKNLKKKYTKIMMETFDDFNDNDFKKWHDTDNKIPTIKIERIKKDI